MPLPLYLLAVAVFAMGTSEFMLAGLLPDIASDLGVTVGAASSLTSAFAVGMVVGAPLMAALARNWPRRSSLFGCVVVFLTAHAVAAVTSSFAVLFATRVVAALANAGFLAVALTTATTLVAPERKGRALAVLLSGTTAATVVGVPGEPYWVRLSGGVPPSGASQFSVFPPPSAFSGGSRAVLARPAFLPCEQSSRDCAAGD